ncbi:hypothetical protein HK098_003601 [Nowakowskiella sp. JEL0407]|nr:hypothetical protein HK098_003601 [Nowakowskiella sp. JEL0407]
MSIQRLPADILIIIFLLVDDPHTLSCVCRLLRQTFYSILLRPTSTAARDKQFEIYVSKNPNSPTSHLKEAFDYFFHFCVPTGTNENFNLCNPKIYLSFIALHNPLPLERISLLTEYNDLLSLSESSKTRFYVQVICHAFCTDVEIHLEYLHTTDKFLRKISPFGRALKNVPISLRFKWLRDALDPNQPKLSESEQEALVRMVNVNRDISETAKTASDDDLKFLISRELYLGTELVNTEFLQDLVVELIKRNLCEEVSSLIQTLNEKFLDPCMHLDICGCIYAAFENELFSGTSVLIQQLNNPRWLSNFTCSPVNESLVEELIFTDKIDELRCACRLLHWNHVNVAKIAFLIAKDLDMLERILSFAWEDRNYSYARACRNLRIGFAGKYYGTVPRRSTRLLVETERVLKPFNQLWGDDCDAELVIGNGEQCYCDGNCKCEITGVYFGRWLNPRQFEKKKFMSRNSLELRSYLNSLTFGAFTLKNV